MNAIFPSVLKRLYRKEPISSFIIIVGAIDAVIGGANEVSPLMMFGLLTSGVAIGYRWWCIQQARTTFENKSRQLYLPPQSERTPLNLDSRRQPPL